MLVKFAENLANYSPLLNIWNILFIPKVFFVLNNPIKYIIYLLNPKNTLKVSINTPIGKIRIELRNRENAKILYSLFIREDYKIKNEPYNFVDLGANIGISALYFVSRNIDNKIISIEHDFKNINFLIKNLNQKKFKDRYKILNKAIDYKKGNKNLLISENGVYSTFYKQEHKYNEISQVEVITFDDLMEYSSFFDLEKSIVLKIDIEGIEDKSFEED